MELYESLDGEPALSELCEDNIAACDPANFFFTDANDLTDEITSGELEAAAMLLGRTSDDISQYQVVYDPSYRPLFLVVEFKSGGFVLMMRTLRVPWEFSRTGGGSPYSGHHGEKLFYLGMLAYARGENGAIYMIRTGARVSDEQLESAIAGTRRAMDAAERDLVR